MAICITKGTLENHYYAIGMLINDLRKGREIQTEGIEEEIKDTFIDILKRLAYAWFQKVEWIDYMLDFHRAEAERLKIYVSPEAGRDYPAIRACLHKELTLLLKRLDMMINAEDYVNLDDLM